MTIDCMTIRSDSIHRVCISHKQSTRRLKLVTSQYSKTVLYKHSHNSCVLRHKRFSKMRVHLSNEQHSLKYSHVEFDKRSIVRWSLSTYLTTAQNKSLSTAIKSLPIVSKSQLNTIRSLPNATKSLRSAHCRCD